MLGDRLADFVEAFYNWLRPLPEYEEFIHDGELEAEIRKLQIRYWERFFSGRVDEQYVADRRRVGATHARIGLPMNSYFAAMNMSLETLIDHHVLFPVQA